MHTLVKICSFLSAFIITYLQASYNYEYSTDECSYDSSSYASFTEEETYDEEVIEEQLKFLIDQTGAQLIQTAQPKEDKSLQAASFLELFQTFSKVINQEGCDRVLHLTLNKTNATHLLDIANCEAIFRSYSTVVTFDGQNNPLSLNHFLVDSSAPIFPYMVGVEFKNYTFAADSEQLTLLQSFLSNDSYRNRIRALHFGRCQGQGLLEHISGHLKNLKSLKFFSAEQSDLFIRYNSSNAELASEVLLELDQLQILKTDQFLQYFNPFVYQHPGWLTNRFLYIAPLNSYTRPVEDCIKLLLFGENFQFPLYGEWVSGALSKDLQDQMTTSHLHGIRVNAYNDFYNNSHGDRNVMGKVPLTTGYLATLVPLSLPIDSVESAVVNLKQHPFLQPQLKFCVELSSPDDFEKILPMLVDSISAEITCVAKMEDHIDNYSHLHKFILSRGYKQVHGGFLLRQLENTPDYLSWSAKREILYTGKKSYPTRWGQDTNTVKLIIHEGDFVIPKDEDHFWLSRILEDFPTFPEVLYSTSRGFSCYALDYFFINPDKPHLYTGSSIENLYHLLKYTLCGTDGVRRNYRNWRGHGYPNPRFVPGGDEANTRLKTPAQSPYIWPAYASRCEGSFHAHHKPPKTLEPLKCDGILGFGSYPDLYFAFEKLRHVDFEPHFINRFLGSTLPPSENDYKDRITSINLGKTPLLSLPSQIVLCEALKYQFPVDHFIDFLSLDPEKLTVLEIHHNAIHKSIMSDNLAIDLAPVISGMINLEALVLNNCGLTDESMEALVPALQEISPSLKTLRLSSTEMHSTFWKKETLSYDANLYSIRSRNKGAFSNGGFGDRGAAALLELMPYLENLDCLSLTGNEFSFRMTRQIVQAIANYSPKMVRVFSPKATAAGKRFFEATATIHEAYHLRDWNEKVYSYCSGILKFRNLHISSCLNYNHRNGYYNNRYDCKCSHLLIQPENFLYIENYRDE